VVNALELQLNLYASNIQAMPTEKKIYYELTNLISGYWSEYAKLLHFLYCKITFLAWSLEREIFIGQFHGFLTLRNNVLSYST